MFNIFTNTDDNCVLVRSARCGRQYKFNCTPTYQHITSALNHINAANTLIASELDKLVHTQLQATVYGLNGSSTENITVNILEIAILHNLYKTANLIVQQYAQQLPGDLDQMYELLLMSQMNDMIGRFIETRGASHTQLFQLLAYDDQNSRILELLERSIETGNNIPRDEQGDTLLIAAAKRNNLDLVKKYLRYANLVDKAGNPAMYHALQHKTPNEEIIGLLEIELHQMKCEPPRGTAAKFPSMKAYSVLKDNYLAGILNQCEGCTPRHEDKVRQNIVAQVCVMRPHFEEMARSAGKNGVENDAKAWLASDVFAFQENGIMISPLIYAAVVGDIALIQQFAGNFLCSECPRTGVTALLMALRTGNFAAAKHLLQESNIFTKRNVTPFVASIAGGNYEYAVEHFSDQRDIPDIFDKLPLHQAVVSRDTVAFDALKHEAMRISPKSWSCLEAAAHYGYADFVYSLIPYQAGFVASGEISALQRAVVNSNGGDTYMHIIRMLLPFEARLTAQDESTALMYSLEIESISDTIRELLSEYEKGMINKEAKTALFFAAQMKNMAWIRRLYDHEVYITEQTVSMFEFALYNEDDDLATFLLCEKRRLFWLTVKGRRSAIELCSIYGYIPPAIKKVPTHINELISAYTIALFNNNRAIAREIMQMINNSTIHNSTRQKEYARVECYDK